jgi:hypothetical protein
LWPSDFLRDWLTVGKRAGDMNLDGLHRLLAALVDRRAAGETAGQCRDGDVTTPTTSQPACRAPERDLDQ